MAIHVQYLEYQITYFTSYLNKDGKKSGLAPLNCGYHHIIFTGSQMVYPLLTKNELETLQTLAGKPNELPLQTLKRLLVTSHWLHSDKLVEFLKEPLMRLCARYVWGLLLVKSVHPLWIIYCKHSTGGGGVFQVDWHIG